MRPIRTVPPKDEREYPLVITAEEKDKSIKLYFGCSKQGKKNS